MPTNDHRPDSLAPSPPAGDAHGQAALILVESLLHGLKERSILSTADSLDILTSAIEVQADVAADAPASAAATMWRSHMLLSCIADSVRTDQ